MTANLGGPWDKDLTGIWKICDDVQAILRQQPQSQELKFYKTIPHVPTIELVKLTNPFSCSR